MFRFETYTLDATQPRRRGRILFALALLCLAAAVFSWGLASKLSLYETAASATHPVQVAKLLSQRERPSDALVALLELERPLTVAAAGLVWLTILPMLFAAPRCDRRTSLRGEPGTSPRACAGLIRFFFRPPPIPALL